MNDYFIAVTDKQVEKKPDNEVENELEEIQTGGDGRLCETHLNSGMFTFQYALGLLVEGAKLVA